MDEKEFENYYAEKEPLLKRAVRDLENTINDLLRSKEGISTRARLVESRLKPKQSCLRQAKELELDDAGDLLSTISDLLGARIVCHNLSDIQAISDLLEQSPSLQISFVDSKVDDPDDTGYRATHIDAEIEVDDPPQRVWIPCEIQIRTVLQDAWGVLSRADLYRSTDYVPPLVGKLAARMSDQLSALDKMAQDIRDELDRKRVQAAQVDVQGPITSDGVNALYFVNFRDVLPEESLLRAMEVTQRLGLSTLDELATLSTNGEARRQVDEFYREHLGREPIDFERFLATIMVASEDGTWGEVFRDFLSSEYDLTEYECESCGRYLTSYELSECWNKTDYNVADTYCEDCFPGRFHPCDRCGDIYIRTDDAFCSSCLEYMRRQ